MYWSHLFVIDFNRVRIFFKCSYSCVYIWLYGFWTRTVCFFAPVLETFACKVVDSALQCIVQSGRERDVCWAWTILPSGELQKLGSVQVCEESENFSQTCPFPKWIWNWVIFYFQRLPFENQQIRLCNELAHFKTSW